jgi:hypothetical protein
MSTPILSADDLRLLAQKTAYLLVVTIGLILLWTVTVSSLRPIVNQLGCSEYIGGTAGLHYDNGRWIDGYGNTVGYSAHEDTTIYDQAGCGR